MDENISFINLSFRNRLALIQQILNKKNVDALIIIFCIFIFF